MDDAYDERGHNKLSEFLIFGKREKGLTKLFRRAWDKATVFKAAELLLLYNNVIIKRIAVTALMFVALLIGLIREYRSFNT